MKTYNYEGWDESGVETDGTIEAESEAQAREKLSERNISVEQLAEVLTASEDSLRPAEAQEVAAQISDLIAGGLPISEGLRAAAQELGPPTLNPFRILWGLVGGRSERRIRSALLRIAQRVESGQPLDKVVQTHNLPAELKAILQADIPSQRQAMAIGEYTVYSNTTSRLRSHVAFLFAYPLFALCAACSLVSVFLYYLAPQIRKVFDDFDTELPVLTDAVFAASDMVRKLNWFPVFFGPFLLVAVFCILLSSGSLRRLIPLLGTSFRNLELAKTTHLLAVSLRHHAPIPSALRAAGAGSDSKHVAAAFDELACTVEAGQELPKSLPELRGLPLGFVQVVQDGSDRDTAADALHTIATLFERRSRVIMSMLAAIVQPVVVVGVCAMIGICLLSLFMPLIKLLNDLT